MKKQLFKAGIFMMLAGVTIFSCKDKDKKTDADQDVNTTLDNANAQSVSDDALKLSEDVLTQNNSAKIAAGGQGQGVKCATVDSIKYSTNHYQFTVTFDGICNSYDNKVRSGSLQIDVNGGTYNTPGAVTTIKTSDYTVNGVKFSGKKTVTCVVAGQHNIVVSDASGSGYATITYANGQTASWRTQRTRTLVSGGSTATISDNVYDISATNGVNPVAEGINKEQRHYVVNITSPIRINFNCFTNNTTRYPTQGVLELIPDGKVARSVDYGSGDCDNAVTVKVGSFSFPVTLSY